MLKETYEAIILTKEETSKEIEAFFDKEIGEGNYNFVYEGYKNLAYSIQGCEKAHYYYISGLEIDKVGSIELSDKIGKSGIALRYLVLKEV
jgi:ribosomal protein S6